ncbi:MAG TPA: alpha-amylase family glycosyl hydrolase [Burkholderiales bacterium]|nr:alpha-amylase family glycosyl hydrolase [Burkholderiales bacterium]
MITVRFTYLTGVKRPLFHNARLAGSWNGWSETPMQAIVGDDGCPAFTAIVTFEDSRAGEHHDWGVRLDAPGAPNAWGINLEVHDAYRQDRHRHVVLPDAGRALDARYHFTYCRRLGAQKTYRIAGALPQSLDDAEAGAELRFAVWAPHATQVDAVFGCIDNGYIADDGTGIDTSAPEVVLRRTTDGIWESAPVGPFDELVGAPYMFRIVTAEGATVYRTDVFSRWQIGRGSANPRGGRWDGDAKALDGSVSCSVIVDQDVVREAFEPAPYNPKQIADDEFWAIELTPGVHVPSRVEDLVIYEMHVGALGYPESGPGTLAHAMALLDYLVDLGVNAVELLPLSEFSGNFSWGYGDTHHFVVESSAGGRDKYKHFVRECHRRGIAVIQDVVYNHFDNSADRAEWQYDSALPENNVYYWYERRSGDYASPDGGYLDNGSSGYTPRFWEEHVRQLFISSAVEFVEEFHVDGLRVDLTQAIHRDNALHANGAPVASANLYGQKFLREWSRTLKLVRPSAMLIAEDHTGWDAVTRTPNAGGLGFDATWLADFYHQLVGDSDMAGGAARLLRDAGFGGDGPLRMQQFAGALHRTQFGHVAYHESHDEAGNAGGSLRTSRVAVNDAPLAGSTRTYAEARCRVAAGLAILSAATPMFFMGEEIVAQKLYRYDNTGEAKEDLFGERAGAGARMFRYYQDLIRLRLANPAARSPALDVIHANDDGRVIAFTRRHAGNDLLVIASFANFPYGDGYILRTDESRLPSGAWRETFNSDSALYGGDNVGNYGAAIPAAGGRIEVRIPAKGLLVFQRV